MSGFPECSVLEPLCCDAICSIILAVRINTERYPSTSRKEGGEVYGNETKNSARDDSHYRLNHQRNFRRSQFLLEVKKDSKIFLIKRCRDEIPLFFILAERKLHVKNQAKKNTGEKKYPAR